jgi:phage baseplate assembly protein W
MPDLSHQWGSDLALSPTGDLALAADAELTRQRVLKRLLTNQGDYIWQLDYGAGLPGFVGQPANPARIAALIRSQIFKEPGVARTPEPNISVSPITGSGPTAGLSVQIQYADATSGATQSLSFSAGA